MLDGHFRVAPIDSASKGHAHIVLYLITDLFDLVFPVFAVLGVDFQLIIQCKHVTLLSNFARGAPLWIPFAELFALMWVPAAEVAGTVVRVLRAVSLCSLPKDCLRVIMMTDRAEKAELLVSDVRQLFVCFELTRWLASGKLL